MSNSWDTNDVQGRTVVTVPSRRTAERDTVAISSSWERWTSWTKVQCKHRIEPTVVKWLYSCSLAGPVHSYMQDQCDGGHSTSVNAYK